MEKLRDITLAEDEILVSFDVTALFPSIPINSAIDFQFRNKFYQQTSGTYMGSKLAPYTLAQYLHLEENLKQNFKLFTRIWFRYVDDIFAIVKQPNLSAIFEYINTRHPPIKYTMETEENGKLNFLDIKIIRTNNN